MKRELRVRPLKKLLYHHAATDALQRLEIKGPLSASLKNSVLTDKCIELLNERCPNLTTLILESYDLENLTYLPKTLKNLALIKCRMPTDEFTSHLIHKISQLKSLDFTQSTKIGPKDLKVLKNYSGITELNLDGCYRISATHLENSLSVEFLSQLNK